MAPAEEEPARLTAVDWGLLLALAGLSVWMAAVALWHARGSGLTWSGTDGPYLGDQMQYLGWISDASHDLRIGNPFRIEDTTDRFVHPGLAISGVLHRLGLSTAAAYLVWKPVAVLTLFLGTRAYVRRLVTDPVHRAFALALALLAYMPMPALFDALGVGRSFDGVYFRALASDMFPGLYLWGYPFTAIAVGLMPITLLLYDRARRERRIGLAPATVLLCGWLQPWQGATLVAIVLGAELWRWHTNRGELHARLTLVFGVAAAVPLAYYAVLSRVDASWELAGEANRADPWPWTTVLAFFAPVALVTVLELRHRVDGFQAIALRLWPVAALAAFWIISCTPFGTFPLHAVQGLSIPLAVMAVRGIASLSALRRSPVVLVALAGLAFACLGPVLVGELRSGASSMLHRDRPMLPPSPYFLQDDEVDALQFLADSRREGGVLARFYLGQTIPGLTGRRTWLGIASWTPDFGDRVGEAEDLFRGALPPDRARAFVAGSGAVFLLDDCLTEADLEALLGDLVERVHPFGCAAVYELS